MKRYLFLLLSFFALGLNAQQMKLTGNAVAASDKQPMIGLTVVVKGTTHGTVTDLDGNYTLSNVSKDATVVFSMIGYKTQEIKVNGRTAINVVMHDDMQALDEVVVIGYGAVKKGDLTSSIAAIKGCCNVWKPAEAEKENLVSPFFPFLVVIRMTPFDARVP